MIPFKVVLTVFFLNPLTGHWEGNKTEEGWGDRLQPSVEKCWERAEVLTNYLNKVGHHKPFVAMCFKVYPPQQ